MARSLRCAGRAPAPVHLGAFDEADLILGMNELKHLHLYFAFKDQMIHVTAADAGR